MVRLCTKGEMQVTENEAEENVLTYVVEVAFRKQRRRSPSCNSLIKVECGRILVDLWGKYLDV